MPKKIIGTETIKKPMSRSELNKKGLCDYVVNVATGCLHGCLFCYVPSTPVVRMRGQELAEKGVKDSQMDWGDYLLTREGEQNEPLWESLDRQISGMRSWRSTPAGKGVVMLCSGTDPYQNPVTAALTRQCVKALLKHGKRVRILTRGLLWLNDLDILVHPNVTVGMSLPHFDDQLSRAVEPFAPRPSDRLKAMQKGKEAGCRLYVAMAPTPPVLRPDAIREHLSRLIALEPEVIFWEPINSRGSNGKRMAKAGIDWGEEPPGWEWIERRLITWQEIETVAKELGCDRLIHYWPDKIWKRVCDPLKIEYWWGRPTIETWNS